MARYRNARYAPEALERKLSPSATGIAPTPVLLDTMVAPGANATAVTTLDAGYGSTSTMNSVDYIPYVAPTGPSPSSPNLYCSNCLAVNDSTSTMNSVDYIPYVALTGPSSSSPYPDSTDCLLVNGDDTLPPPAPPAPYPGEGLPPLDPPPSPVGPVGRA